MEKIDLAKIDKNYYRAASSARLINVVPSGYAAISGKGDPAGQSFKDEVAALYAFVYALKFFYKAKKQDFVVAKLEGLWWYDENRFKVLSATEAPSLVPRSEWHYQMLIRLPDYVSFDDFERVKIALHAKKHDDRILRIHPCRLNEGRVVQILHRGSYAAEPVTLAILHTFIEDNKLSRNGYHHEIYLSDARKTKPENLKTILRQPVK